MFSRDEATSLLTIICPPVIVAFGAGLFQMLPNEAVFVLVAWVFASLPIGVLIGHCMLSEK